MEQHEPTTEEIVKALRYCADEDKACCSGEKDNICPYYDKGLMAHPNDKNYPEYCDILLMRNAADRLEQLQRENEELTARAERAEKERDAAIADMKTMALVMRESDELQEGCCFACIYDSQNLPDNVMLAYGECPGYDSDDCFEWRRARKETK